MTMIAMFATPAIAATFNLVCSGTITTDSFYARGQKEPYSYTYRIDLDKRKWCEGQCGVIRDIHDVQPVRIELEPPEDTNTPTKKRFFSSTINRTTGVHSTLLTSGRGTDMLIMKWEGSCSKQPFTGFPTFETKF